MGVCPCVCADDGWDSESKERLEFKFVVDVVCFEFFFSFEDYMNVCNIRCLISNFQNDKIMIMMMISRQVVLSTIDLFIFF